MSASKPAYSPAHINPMVQCRPTSTYEVSLMPGEASKHRRASATSTSPPRPGNETRRPGGVQMGWPITLAPRTCSLVVWWEISRFFDPNSSSSGEALEETLHCSLRTWCRLSLMIWCDLELMEIYAKTWPWPISQWIQNITTDHLRSALDHWNLVWFTWTQSTPL
jgi:hypothetical protein